MQIKARKLIWKPPPPLERAEDVCAKWCFLWPILFCCDHTDAVMRLMLWWCWCCDYADSVIRLMLWWCWCCDDADAVMRLMQWWGWCSDEADSVKWMMLWWCWSCDVAYMYFTKSCEEGRYIPANQLFVIKDLVRLFCLISFAVKS